MKNSKYSLFFTFTFGNWSTMIFQPSELALSTYLSQVVFVNVNNMLAEVTSVFSPITRIIIIL